MQRAQDRDAAAESDHRNGSLGALLPTEPRELAHCETDAGAARTRRRARGTLGESLYPWIEIGESSVRTPRFRSARKLRPVFARLYRWQAKFWLSVAVGAYRIAPLGSDRGGLEPAGHLCKRCVKESTQRARPYRRRDANGRSGSVVGTDDGRAWLPALPGEMLQLGQESRKPVLCGRWQGGDPHVSDGADGKRQADEP